MRGELLVEGARWLVLLVAVLLVAVAFMPAAGIANPGPTYEARLSATDGKGEPEVAVNPRDPRNLVAALMSGVVVSHDGGVTWKPTLASTGGDPTVVADRDGRFYVAWIAGADGIRVHVSSDNGETW